MSIRGLDARAFARQYNTVHNIRVGLVRNGNYYGLALPAPHVYLTSPHVTRSPRPSPYTASDHRLELGGENAKYNTTSRDDVITLCSVLSAGMEVVRGMSYAVLKRPELT